MQDTLMNLSFSFGIDLYRAKKRSESRGDTDALISLKFHYPELFTVEFHEFIENVKASTKIVDAEHGTNFFSMLDIESNPDKRILN